MRTPVTMPQLGESVVEGTVARWLKAPGDPVTKLEPILEINTDKIDTEVPAPAAGTLLHIVVAEGETVEAGTVLAYIGDATDATTNDTRDNGQLESTVVTASSTSTPGSDGMTGGETMGGERSHGGVHDQTESAGSITKPKGRVFLSPVVKRIAAEHDVALAEVPGTGTRGRITKQDIMAYIEQRQAEQAIAPLASDATAAKPDGHSELAGTVVPLSLMRRAIAQHMVASIQTSPHVTTIFEVDMTAVVLHRDSHKDSARNTTGRLTYTAYFLSAVAHALRAVPAVNARYVDDDGAPSIQYSNRIHIGVAVALDDGLIVPVIRNADEKNLWGLARSISEVAHAARAGTLPPDATRGGTFTVTNHGISGSLIGTPIINQPQSGILGIGAITKRAVVRTTGNSLLPSADDAIVIRPMCYLSFSFDHRVLDGATADQFVTEVKHALEHWPSNTA